MRVQQLIEDDLNKCSAKHVNKSTLVARGADTQLDSSGTPLHLYNLKKSAIFARTIELQWLNYMHTDVSGIG